MVRDLFHRRDHVKTETFRVPTGALPVH